jgi:hypothetical protein
MTDNANRPPRGSEPADIPRGELWLGLAAAIATGVFALTFVGLLVARFAGWL